MTTRLALLALTLGNVVTGLAVLAPTGMLADLATGLQASISQTGLLITAGAVVLCLGSPLMAWWTSAFDRRVLLTGILVVVAIGHAASAFAPDYKTVLALRVATLAAVAVFTPQAASTAALIVAPANRASAIAFVFLGWSLAVAAGLPTVGWISGAAGWRTAYASIAALAALSGGLVWLGVPAGLRGAGVSLGTWSMLARNRLVMLLLAVTALQTSSQFAVITYFGPLLSLTGATATTIGLFFALFGVTGFIGNLAATQIVRVLGLIWTSLIFLLAVCVGVALWTVATGFLPVMVIGVTFWGLGFTAFNSMQQARLVAAAPDAAPASVALNTSFIYVGQAIGSAIGGALFAAGLPQWTSVTATLIGALSIGVFALTIPQRRNP